MRTYPEYCLDGSGVFEGQPGSDTISSSVAAAKDPLNWFNKYEKRRSNCNIAARRCLKLYGWIPWKIFVR